jgi:ribosomal protein S27AE
MKRCARCEQVLPLRDFGRNGYKHDGLETYCGPCRSEYRKRWRVANRDTLRKGEAAYKAAHPERIVAKSAAQYAVRSGKLTRPDTCERCGAGGAIHAHHDDYSKPLDVRWLCGDCHMFHHAEQRRERRATTMGWLRASVRKHQHTEDAP